MKFTYKEMKDILADIDELEENQTIHIHHCKDGHNNDRLYVTNKGEATLFYCHHCSKRGSLRNNRATYKRHVRSSGTSKYYHQSVHMPSDINTSPRTWPVEALKWPLTARLSFTDMETLGLAYSPRINRVCVPVTFAGEYRGFIARRIEGDGPKYLARYRQDDKDNFIYARCPYDKQTVVIVEDVLSAAKLEKAGYNAVALLGTHISDSLISFLSNYSSYVVWLDDDNPDVKLKQVKLKDKLALFGNVRLIKTDNDPKTYSLEDIKGIVK